MPVTVYQSSDPSAPVLTGAIGSLINVLSACLVTGYGSQPGAGWTMPFSSSNTIVYRAGGGNQRFLQVVDSIATDARVVGYENMTGPTSGTGPFPTASQVSGGLFIHKGVAGSVPRPWIIVATEYCFYAFIDGSLTTSDLAGTGSTQSFTFFGDFISNRPGDIYNTALISRTTSGTAAGAIFGVMAAGASYAALAGHFIARPFTQLGSSITCTKGARNGIAASTIGASGGDFPDPITGNMNLSPLDLFEQTGATISQFARRGRLPGIWAPLHTIPGASMDTFSGTGELAGRTFLVLTCMNSSTTGRIVVETSDTWS